MEQKDYVISYKKGNFTNLLYARLKAKSYQEANEKADKVIDFLNERYPEFNYELFEVRMFSSFEDWD